jgi:hypothetical protein
MSGCATGGCSVGNSYNPGGHYIGIRLNENEDGRVVFCETQGQTLVRRGAAVRGAPPRRPPGAAGMARGQADGHLAGREALEGVPQCHLADVIDGDRDRQG